jgi:hypothetical protein
MAATPAEPGRMAMAVWRTVATSGGCSCCQVSSFGLCQLLAFTQRNQSSYTAHIHITVGGGGPRWRPLIVAVATSQRRDAGGKVPGRQQWRQQHTIATRRRRGFIISWGAGGGVAEAASALQWILNFAICICIFRIRPFSYLFR